MKKPSDREPGIYGGNERLLTDAQLEDIPMCVKAIGKIWKKFSKITQHDHIEQPFVREVSQAIIDYLKEMKLVMSGADSVEVFQILRRFAEGEQQTRH
jgi:hypothetical protein